MLAFSSSFVLSRMVGRSFLPNEDMGEFQLVIDTPEGTSLKGMEKVVLDLTPQLLAVPGVAHVMPTIFERVNHSHIFIQLKPLGERKVSQDEVAVDVRKIMHGASRLQADDRHADADRRRRDGVLPHPAEFHRARTCGSWPATRSA